MRSGSASTRPSVRDERSDAASSSAGRSRHLGIGEGACSPIPLSRLTKPAVPGSGIARPAAAFWSGARSRATTTRLVDDHRDSPVSIRKLSTMTPIPAAKQRSLTGWRSRAEDQELTKSLDVAIGLVRREEGQELDFDEHPLLTYPIFLVALSKPTRSGWFHCPR